MAPLRPAVLGCAVSFVLFIAPVAAAATSERGPSHGRSFTVGYTSDAALDAAVARSGGRVLRRLRGLGVAELSGSSRMAALLAGSSGISFLERPAARTPAVEPGLAQASAMGAFEWQYAATQVDTVPHLSLVAPGERVLGVASALSSPRDYPRVVLPGSRAGLYAYDSGTSYSTPQVAGAAVLVWAANPALTAVQVADYLKGTASGQGRWNPRVGYGVLDVGAAVALALVSR